ncbi:polyketide synthase [Apiospora rasikravindrae]|uniref:Polyketide synthase n=1 Tax=Apiospora rasikravindrae TaxID=990691 RepID=A0ABR1TEC2_9PEZI
MDTKSAETPRLAPVAVVGMACRLSGDVSSPDDLWTMLSRSRDGWCEVPADRFSKKAFYHRNPQRTGTFNIKGGYFMKQDVSKFDAPFFNITKQEATAMDPQQRQLLEVTYEALESAGIPKDTLSGRNMGVYVAGRPSDYRQGTLDDTCQLPLFDATGNQVSVQAGRISYYFNLQGPSFTVDTACSSGLYALHTAVQSIRSGESESAIVAGCCLRLQPDDMISMSMMGIYNEKGRTFAFDSRADSGYAPGEGFGCLILKHLDQALRDNDKIRSIIVNTGINQDGRTVGMTTPSGEAQQRLIQEVYDKAGIDTQDAGFIEAHGTGTKVGDPIEAGAISRVFSAGRSKRNPLYIGSVKSNIGHLEHASGIISIIKASMMLERGLLLPNVNFEDANPAIPLDKWHMKVPGNVRPWPRDKKYISINNFGFGGANAHVVLQRPPSAESTGSPSKLPRGGAKLFAVTANSEESLKKQVKKLGIYIEKHPEIFQSSLFRDMAYTLGQRRTHLPYRIALPATTLENLEKGLNSSTIPKRPVSQEPKLAFVYTGQGAQSSKKIGAGFSLAEELLKDGKQSRISEPDISQSACTAVQLGLTELLKSWKIKPACVIGHSSGEISAAYATGAITLEEAMISAYYRGHYATTLKATHPHLNGGMLAVGKSSAEVKELIAAHGYQDIGVACENSPNSVTVSGQQDSLDQLSAKLESQGVFNRKLRTDVAYHSSHMEVIAKDYMNAIKDMQPADRSEVQMYSSLLGSRLDSTLSLGAEYWINNLTKPVLFSTGLQSLCTEAQPDVIVEVGPHSALEGPIKQILKACGKDIAAKTKYFPSLVRNTDATEAAMALAGHLFAQGQPIDFHAINESQPSPPYPWAEHRYWAEGRHSKQRRLRPFARHDLLGVLEGGYNETSPSWVNILNVDNVPWLRDHRMQSLITFPLAGYLSMAIEAASQLAQLRGIELSKIKGYRIREVNISKALIMEESTDYETSVSLRPHSEGLKSYSDDWDEFRLCSWTSGRGWLEHCRGLVQIKKEGKAGQISSGHLSGAPTRLAEAKKATEKLSTEAVYAELDRFGATYGPVFQMAPDCGIAASEEYAIGNVHSADTKSLMPHKYELPSILPAPFLDLLFHLAFPVLGAGRGLMSALFMPAAIKEFDMSIPSLASISDEITGISWGKADLARPAPADFFVDAWHPSNLDNPIMRMAGFRMVPVFDDAAKAPPARSLCYKVQWEPLHGSPIPEEAPVQENGANGESHDQVDAKANNGVTKSLPHQNGDHDGVRGNGVAVEKIESSAAPSQINGHAKEEQHQSGNGHAAEDAQLNGNSTTTSSSNLPKVPFTIVSDSKGPNELNQAVAALLESKTGAKPSIISFEDVDPNDRPVIVLAELDAPLLNGMSHDVFEKVKKILLTSASTLWVTKGAYHFAENPDLNIAQGLLRTVRSETSKVVATLDLDPVSSLDTAARAELILEAASASLAQPEEVDGPVDYEFAEDAGALVVPRVVGQEDLDLQLHRETTQDAEPYLQSFEQDGRRLQLAVGTLGALDSLYWRDEPEMVLGHNEVEVRVAATGMNFKDVVVAMGQVTQPYLGVECAGTVSRIGSSVTGLKTGDRVCAMSLGAYSTYARCLGSSAAVIPASMSFETAASIPVVYSTAYYGLIEVARLEKGQSVLIHAATGGVGQAAVQLAHLLGADVYCTVGSEEKKQLLMDTYGVPAHRIYSSRSTSFGPAIREATGERGVDVVLNSLAGDLLRESWECLAPFGHFIEIGKRDIVANNNLGMRVFDSNCSFSSVDLTLVASERPQIMDRVLKAVMKLLSEGKVREITPVTSVGIGEVESALRKLQSGKTTGKVVVSHRGEDKIKATHARSSHPMYSNEATYVIVGGTGGIGQSITKQMIERGARHIVLLSRSGKMTEDIKKLVDFGEPLGASVHVKSCDAGDESSVKAVLEDIQKTLPPIRGIVHAAMVLRDVLFEDMTYEDYTTVVRSKVAGAWNLHQALGTQPLDFFILLSSVAGIIGNRGQAAYAGANTFLDALARHRRRHGLPATSLALAAVADVGYLAAGSDGAARTAEVLKSLGGACMTGAEVLALFEAAVTGQVDPLCEHEQCVTGLDFADSGNNLPYYASDGKFAHLRRAALAKCSSGVSSSVSKRTLAQELARVATVDEAVEVVAGGLREKLGAILMVDPAVLAAQQATTSVATFGLDSLNAIELRNWIAKELQTHLQVLELLTAGTLNNLAGLVLKKTSMEGVWTVKGSGVSEAA